MINQLKEHVENKESADQDIPFIEHVVNTVGSAIAGHGRSYNVNYAQTVSHKAEKSVM